MRDDVVMEFVAVLLEGLLDIAEVMVEFSSSPVNAKLVASA